MTSRPPEITDEELVRRADSARQVTTNEMYREAWSSLESSLMTAWEGTKPMQTEEREEIWRSIRTLRATRQTLENLMATGRQAAKRIDQRKRTTTAPGSSL